MRTVRFDLKLPQRIPDTEVRLAARAFVKRQGDKALEIEIKGARTELVWPDGAEPGDFSKGRPSKQVVYFIEGVVEPIGGVSVE